MKTDKKSIVSYICAFILGGFFELAYVYCGDIVVDKLEDLQRGNNHFFGMFMLINIALGLAILYWCRNREDKKVNLTTFSIFVAAAVLTHLEFIRHDSIVYYRLHGKFMPLSDDLGYFFFLSMMGITYCAWILGLIIIFVKRAIAKRKNQK